MTLLAFPSLQTVFDVNGKPVRSAKAYFYSAGTLAPIQVHKVSTLDSPYTQPVPVSALGRFPPIFTNAASYRVRIVDSFGAILEDVDGISGSSGGGGGGGGGVVGVSDQNSLLATGDILFNLRTGARTGFVRLNGRSISSAAGGGTERANNDTQALFLMLWDGLPGLNVAGGRGASSAADWAANKAIDLPDFRGRGPLGADAMGNTLANRLAGGTIDTGGVDTIGSVGGRAADTAPLPNHSHSVQQLTSTNSGGHTPTGTIGNNGAHTHNYSKANSGPTYAAGGFFAYNAVATVATASAGDHSHPLTMDAVPTHFHFVPAHNTDAQGAGGAHNTLSPFVLGTWYMRL